MNPLRKIDTFLNGITMYSLVLNGLRILVGVGLLFAFMGDIALPVKGLVLSLLILTSVCYGANWVLAHIWRVGANIESYAITSLILFLILPPATTLARAALISLVAVLAMVSKYLFVFRGRHIFNPAAIAVVIVGVLGLLPATWWIASPVMLPFVIMLGVLLLRKLRRFQLYFIFAGTALAVMMVLGILHDRALADVLGSAFTSWPLLFLGTVMLTEPVTMPAHRREQWVYGAIVGILFASQLHLGPLYTTPAVALVIGNLYSFAMNRKYGAVLRLKKKTQLSSRVYDFAFTPSHTIDFEPGQYMEWTLPLKKADGRGNRRTFTIASSPTEKEIHMGIKTYEPSSIFKKTLLAMEPGDSMTAGHISGEFTLPKDVATKLVFIAGGIGITPFRSMLKYMLDTGEKRDIVVFYAVTDPEEVSYQEILEQAAKQGVRVIPILGSDKPVLGWKGRTGFLTKDIVAEDAPDYSERTFYLSGPNAMVENYRGQLRSMGIPSSRIKTDYFSGY